MNLVDSVERIILVRKLLNLRRTIGFTDQLELLAQQSVCFTFVVNKCGGLGNMTAKGHVCLPYCRLSRAFKQAKNTVLGAGHPDAELVFG